MFERELTVLQGQHQGERITVMEISFPDHAQRQNYLELRVEHHVAALGWVVQRRIPIGSMDVCELRSALTLFAASSHRPCCQGNVVAFSDYQESRIA